MTNITEIDTWETSLMLHQRIVSERHHIDTKDMTCYFWTDNISRTIIFYYHWLGLHACLLRGSYTGS